MNRINENLLRIARYLEIVIAVVVLLMIGVAMVSLLIETIPDISIADFDLEQFLSSALTLVVGIEFVKMLFLHTPESVIEVLLYAVARQVILSHDSAMENLIGVLAVGIIFVIRYFLKNGSIVWTPKKKAQGGNENER